MRTKSLTFKSPNKVKTLTLIFIVCFIVFPSVRYTTADVLRSTASLISPQYWNQLNSFNTIMRNIQVHSTHSIRFTNYAKTWCEIINQHRKVFPEHTFKQIAKCYDLSESNVRRYYYGVHHFNPGCMGACYNQMRKGACVSIWFDSSFSITKPSKQSNKMIRYEVRFQTPYNSQEWRSQFFNTIQEAESMVAFYLSCGSKSYMV